MANGELRTEKLDPIIGLAENYCVLAEYSGDLGDGKGERVLVSVVLYGKYHWPSSCERWFEPETFS